MPDFVRSADLNEAFHREVVAPALSGWRYGCGLLGWGSDVLGYDDATSTDHGWGPRLVVFVEADDTEPAKAAVEAVLPSSFRGWPVRYADPRGAVHHYVTITTLRAWLIEQLGLDPREGLTNLDWLVLPQQQLLGVVRGPVYHDGVGVLVDLRRQLAWFPPDVELWIVASQWRRVWQDEAFVGRASQVGDEVGSVLLAGRLVRDLMRLCFLFAGQYWPYSKWFGTAFRELPDDDGLGPMLMEAALAPDYPRREAALVAAYELTAARHNRWGRTSRMEVEVRNFHDRPFKVLLPERSIELCLERIQDEALRSLPLVGSIDQATDSTDVAAYPARAAALRGWYGHLCTGGAVSNDGP
jgi:hypothetical protein